MIRFFFAALLLVSSSAFSQGIRFETGDWKAVLDKAKKERKLIYVDIYTTWCGPCKMLAAQIFPLPEAGAVYNRHFVNYRIDAEKGEGITLAKQYAVDRYPTHLFVDPASQKLVYRGTGASARVEDFNHHAEVALKEHADPMTLANYAAKYKAGERSERFLRAYLEKAARLHQPDESVLGSYVDAVSRKPASDSVITFILSQVTTLDGKAVPYLIANAPYFAARPNAPGLSDNFGRWINASFEQAVRQRDPAMLDTLLSRIGRYTGRTDSAISYWHRTQFYAQTGNLPAMLTAGTAEADYLTARPLSYYQAEDAKAAVQARQSIRMQLMRMNADSSRLDELVELNMQQQPAALRSSSLFTASTLNRIARIVFEQERKNAALVDRALTWTGRSMELADGTQGWPAFAGTHALLLYAAGRKEDALKIQEAAMSKASPNDAPSMKTTLDAMKAGTL